MVKKICFLGCIIILSVFAIVWWKFFKTEKYSILDEAGYCTIMYDTQNSMIIQFMEEDSVMPDQRAQIETAYAKDKNKVMDAELRAALVIGNMNLLKVKEITIKALNANGISVYDGVNNFDKLMESISYLHGQIKESMDELSAEGGLNLEDAFISYYLQDPAIDFSSVKKELPIGLVNTAVQIAVSRFDNLKWHQKIGNCMRENENEKELMENKIKILVYCAQDYNREVSMEVAKVVKQLLPHRSYFERMQSVPDKSEMVKVKNEQGYMWQKK